MATPGATTRAVIGAVIAAAIRRRIGKRRHGRDRDRADGQGRRAREPLGRHRPLHRRDLPLLRRSAADRRAASRSAASTTATGSASSRSRSSSGSRSSTRSTRRQRPHDLYSATESSSAWPKFGQINFSSSAPSGRHYSVGVPGMGRQALRLRQLPAGRPLRQLALQRASCSPRAPAANGALQLRHLPGPALARRPGAGCTTSPAKRTGATRATRPGFVVPSQDEWIKAAYYDPSGGGTYSYWKYPTNAGRVRRRHGDRAEHDDARSRAPATSPTPRRSRSPPTTRRAARHPTWCPAAVSAERLLQRQPVRDRSDDLRGGLPGQPRHRRPGPDHFAVGHARPGRQRGRVDRHDHRRRRRATATAAVWRRLHGGIANAPAYQLWLSAVGLQPQDNAFYDRTYPWLGFRIGVIGNLKAKQR